MTNENNKDCKMSCGNMTFDSLLWWATLLMAVIILPAIAIIVMSLMPENELVQMIAFVVTCWICTLIGVRLMNVSKKKDS